MNETIHFIDYLIVALYLAGIFYLASRSSHAVDSTNLVEDQYLAGKSLTIPESLFSIIATEISALTFLGLPAFAYASDFSFIHIYFGAIIGRIVIARVMLPAIYDKGLTLYTVMGKTGTENGQRAVAIAYATNKLLAIGVRLFAGSILVSEFFTINIYIAVSIICMITFFYTLIGGLKAVVRTDMVQMALFVLGGIAAHFLIPQIANESWSSLMAAAMAADKTSFLDFSNPLPFLIGVVGGILYDMATHGVDQDFVQRLTANRSLRGAKIAIMTSSFVSIAVGLLFLGIGSLLWAYYQTNAAPLVPNDKIFAHFITNYFPIGLKGLMVAGVLAATMSTLDSTINALSACLHSDILHQRGKNNKKIKQLYKKDTFIITIGLMLIAFIASFSDGLLTLGLKITSWTAGSLLSLFFATLIFKTARLNTLNVIAAYIIGISGVALNTFVVGFHWSFNVYFAFILASILLYILGKKKPLK